MNARRDPPVLLAIGLALTAIKAIFYLVVGGLALLVFLGVLTAGSIPLAGSTGGGGLFAWAAAGGLGALLIGAFLLLQVLKLYVCVRAWEQARPWLVVLLVATAVGILIELPSVSCCFFPLIVDLLLLIGSIQALAQKDPV